jgi:ADP-heptose:LPS heptosyltransferase
MNLGCHLPAAKDHFETDDSPKGNPQRRAAAGRLLLCNVSRLGDTILCNAILDSAYRSYARIDYLCGSHNAELVRSDPQLGRVTVIRNLTTGLPKLFMTMLRCRYDTYIDLKDHASTTSLVIARFVRSRIKIGYNCRGHRPFQRDTGPLRFPPAHKVEIMRRIGALAGLVDGEYKPRLLLPADSIAWFRRNHSLNRPFVFLNVSASHPNRIWPAENWARYIRGCGLGGWPIVVNGLPRHRKMVQRLCREFPQAVPCQARHFMDVAAAIAEADLVLTVDTAVVHACSALNRPLVGLFCASAHDIVYAPLSTWQLVIRSPAGFVTDIDAEQAIAETRRHGLPMPFQSDSFLPKLFHVRDDLQSAAVR